MPRFICNETCQLNTHGLVEEGQVINLVSLDLLSEGMRQYFDPEPTAAEHAQMEDTALLEKQEIAKTRQELDELGVAYAQTWGLAKLKGVLKLAIRDAAPKNLKPMDKMNKDELQAKATELEVEFDENDTKKELVDKISDKINELSNG